MPNKTKEAAKDRVASFRIAKSVDNAIEEQLVQAPIVGCDTANKFYRKLALDWHAGRLIYKNPEDAKADPEVLAAMEAMDQPSPPATIAVGA